METPPPPKWAPLFDAVCQNHGLHLTDDECEQIARAVDESRSRTLPKGADYNVVDALESLKAKRIELMSMSTTMADPKHNPVDASAWDAIHHDDQAEIDIISNSIKFIEFLVDRIQVLSWRNDNMRLALEEIASEDSIAPGLVASRTLGLLFHRRNI